VDPDRVVLPATHELLQPAALILRQPPRPYRLGHRPTSLSTANAARRATNPANVHGQRARATWVGGCPRSRWPCSECMPWFRGSVGGRGCRGWTTTFWPCSQARWVLVARRRGNGRVRDRQARRGLRRVVPSAGGRPCGHPRRAGGV